MQNQHGFAVFLPVFDKNIVGLDDLGSLNVVKFEVFPHFEEKHRKLLSNYEKQHQVKVRSIADREFIVEVK